MTIVIKLGGSLFDLPDLCQRLSELIATLRGERPRLIAGGGPFADGVRIMSRLHGIENEAAHWAAIRSMSVSADLIRSFGLAADVDDPLVWLQADEGQPGSLPHSWSVTSDSIAARMAERHGAARLLLLKSVVLPERIGWAEAARQGFVDGYFPILAKRLEASGCAIEWVCLRD